MKKLSQQDFKMEIVEDLGMIHETTKKPTRTALFKCSCGEIEKISVSNAKSRVTCKKCSRKRQQEKITVKLNQSEYSMRIVEDLGTLKQDGTERAYRFAIFECTHCRSSFKARATGKAAKKQKLCHTCAATCLRGSDKQLYSIWNTIKQRCYNTKRKDFSKYGGKGVTMQEDWIDNPKAFIEWCENNGWKPGLVVDKDIKSEELGITPPIYSSSTLSFITAKQNSAFANSKAVAQYSLDGEELNTFSSAVEAAIAVNKPKGKSNIAACCRGETSTSYGFKWRFKNSPSKK